MGDGEPLKSCLANSCVAASQNPGIPTMNRPLASIVCRFGRRTMRREHKYVASFCLSAALLTPVGALAMRAPQDEHERHEQEEREHRVYDPVRRDYRNWDARESEAYHKWLEEKHEAYTDYDRLDRKGQEEYGKWRHRHEEHEEH